MDDVLQGCGTHGCRIAEPVGQAVNGGCCCDERAIRLALRYYRQRCAEMEGELATARDYAGTLALIAERGIYVHWRTRRGPSGEERDAMALGYVGDVPHRSEWWPSLDMAVRQCVDLLDAAAKVEASPAPAAGSEERRPPSFGDLEGINLSGELDPTEYVRRLRDDEGGEAAGSEEG